MKLVWNSNRRALSHNTVYFSYIERRNLVCIPEYKLHAQTSQLQTQSTSTSYQQLQMNSNIMQI